MLNLGGNKPVIPILTGPTGAGKTGVALRLLEKQPDIHVISADSRQIYKYLNIGTDKPPVEILEKYHFHLTDFIQPSVRYTAFDFVRDAEKIIDDSLAGGDVPLICGGTGLYIKALVDGIVEIEDDLSIREQLENEVIEKGPKYLYEKLEKIDPQEIKKIHPHNIKKIIRALEIFYITGKTKSELIASTNYKARDYAFKTICLMPERDVLYDKINKRVDEMMRAGLLDEVKTVCKLGLKETVEDINIIGYAEMIKHVNGELDMLSAVNLIKQNSRRFAKRQITWFKGMKDIKYVSSADMALENLIPYW
jgi:tRNA dimethylallyltransferase